MSDRLRVLHLPNSYLPWTVGGQEVYCYGLNQELRLLGADTHVAFHQNEHIQEPLGDTEHKGVPVHVLPAIVGMRARTAIYSHEPAAVPGFADLLQRLRPEIVHFHDFSVGVNILHLRQARAYGARVVMTYHTPGQFCLQRSLLYRGRKVCNGEIHLSGCSACRLGVTGIPVGLDYLIAGLPHLGWSENSTSPLLRALTVRTTTRRFMRAWTECSAGVDRFIVHAEWTMALMRRNGVPTEKLTTIRSGWSKRRLVPIPPSRHDDSILRLAFLGRTRWIKGIHVLIEAVRRLPQETPIRVAFFGSYWQDAYGQQLLQLIHDDPRFEQPRLLEPEQVVDTLRGFDACVVPSLWLETGPLVVLEAFAAGIPVIGSRLGGIAELVKDGENGLLFPAGNTEALRSLLAELINEPASLQRLRAGVRPPRTMTDVAREMKMLYTEVLSESRS